MSRTRKQCGFCSLLGGFARRVMCIGSRRGSSESYYRELGDQDTLKIDGSQGSEDSVELEHDCKECQEASGDARGRPSTSSAPQQHQPESPQAQAQGPAEQIPTPADTRECTPEEVPAVAVELELISTDPTRRRLIRRFLSIHKRRKRRLPTRSLQQEVALLDDLLNGQVQCALNQCSLWDFNAFTLDNVAGGHGLPALCVYLFQEYGLISHFRLDPVKVWKLFTLFEVNYHASNPYHNSIHAADVTQAMHCFLQQTQILAYMQPIEIMAGLVAAMAHDLDHPGVNQPFLMATSNHLVTLYQSKSVLENHHWRSAISCLMESNVLDEMPHYQQELLQEKIRSLILATDITRQQDYLSQFKAYLDTNTLDMTRGEHRHLVLQIALKCADISNPCRPWKISKMWSLKVCEEFFRQGDIERRLQLPLSPLCDRHTSSIPNIQTGFFKYVVTPLITEWHRFLQSDLSEQMLKNLVINHQRWETLAQDSLEVSPADNRTTAAAAETDVEDERELSGSSELLLPRRSSLNPASARPAGFREQLRRFSMPLNLRPRNRDQSLQEVAGALRSETADGSPTGSGPSLQDDRSPELITSSENLLPESSIASITTPRHAQRLNDAFHDPNWSLVRQPTSQGRRARARAQSLIPPASTHEESICPRAVHSDSGVQFDSNVERESGQDEPKRVPSRKASSHLRENLSSIPLDLDRRRKSIPARAEPSTSRDRRFRDLLPQLIARSFSRPGGGRRGSAPAHVTDEPIQREPVPSQREPRDVRASRQLPPALPRRSSLPVEVFHAEHTHSPSPE